MLVTKYMRYKNHQDTDLVYLVTSPDYCEYDVKKGSLGTKGRECDPASKGIDGCDLLCCNRGYTTRRERRTERCRCKFHWCCYVECEECVRDVQISTCNWDGGSTRSMLGHLSRGVWSEIVASVLDFSSGNASEVRSARDNSERSHNSAIWLQLRAKKLENIKRLNRPRNVEVTRRIPVYKTSVSQTCVENKCFQSSPPAEFILEKISKSNMMWLLLSVLSEILLRSCTGPTDPLI